MIQNLNPISTLFIAGVITGCAQREKKALSDVDNNRRPNVLILLADDQRADALGCSGNSYIRTPNIDSLASNGIHFRNAYIMGGHHGAISAPSRAMLLSGKHLFHVYDTLAGVTTMPMQFGINGYETFGTGKWHNEKSAFESSFQKARNVFLGGMANHFQVPCRSLESEGKLSEPEMKGFSTDIFAGSAVDYIKEYASSSREKPFFCYVAFTVPHDPYSPRPDFIDSYPDQSLPLPGNYLPLHPFQFDDLMVRDENLLPWPRSPEMVRSVLSDYYAMVTHLDKAVGTIIETLKQNGLYDNTIIVYAADNGLAAGSHGLLGKQNLYEHSMKVPLIITGPGIPEGKSSGAFVYLYDIFPTLAEICRVPSPAGIDGKSLIKVITGESEGVRKSLFTAYRRTVRAVRTAEWKLIRYPERDYDQLFNLAKDPFELNNLAADDKYISIHNDMTELLKRNQAELEDPAPYTAARILPLEYDYTKLVRKPDQWQPEYTLKKYFQE
ncbi:MAG TPA: sulfatase-like hydrolase/transferase [Bacteroidales bacterium]|nr:sulfatase-like hydrolase/transferase [Bacteroidales bacterium]